MLEIYIFFIKVECYINYISPCLKKMHFQIPWLEIFNRLALECPLKYTTRDGLSHNYPVGVTNHMNC